ncbi:MAG: phosphatidate cytidylyltransferase [Chryseobacterium sp.]|nr:MAG: phosphatidate cytidylyltransferase [Chryseobacterium sp.]
MDKNLIQRLISGLVYGLVIFFCTTPFGAKAISAVAPFYIPQHYLYFGLITFFMIVGLYECARIVKFKKIIWALAVVPLAAFIYYRFAYKYFHLYFYYNADLTELFGILLMLMAIVILFRFRQELSFDSGKLIFTVVYVTFPFGYALGLPDFNPFAPSEFSWEVFMLFALIWSSDSFAYFAGRMFGKHKMAPTISPKKTWEGFAGGVICTVILGAVIQAYGPEMKGNWMIVGLLVAVFAPLGDLVESQLKRTFNVKDSGNIIPGHGGVLDRLDSFILCAPVMYIYFMLEKLI